MIKIIAVKYLNTLPFVHGIEKSGLLNDYLLELDIPSVCARKVEDGDADIGLVPVAALDNLKNFEIFTDYCIGAQKSVGSVLLVAEKPIDQLTEIYLDYQSRTTNYLIQIIYNKYLNTNPLWINGSVGFEKSISGSTGGIVIGDRALELKDKFQFSYDLATLWNEFTGLPFVFACWVAKSSVSKSIISDFSDALTWGVAHKHEAIKHNTMSIDLKHYFDNCISYEFTDKKKEALELYLEEMRKLKVPQHS
ncbi:MAG: menaquinone biosynthesis protein [Flavobacteriales bacterium]|nr:menaquinone biosynthesis protein [Flavobacteriales bacterium]